MSALGSCRSARACGAFDGRACAVDQAVQEVEDVGLGGDAVLEGEFHGAEHRPLVVLQHEGEDVHHLPIAPWSLQQLGL